MATDALRSLVVSLEARIDKFEANMKQASDTTTRSMNAINDTLGKAKQQFLGLAASVVSVSAAIQSVKGAIALGDELKQMSDSTGIAIAKLDQLSIVAKLNGAGLDDMAKGFKGLGKSIIESQDAASKSGKLFQALGVSVKDSAGNLRGVDEVMGDVAKALNSIENETTRAAVGTAIFGKSYLQIAATLRNFEADQQAANDVLEKFGSVSVQAANLSDELGDRLTLLGEGSKRALLTGLVPGLAAASQAIQEVINQGGAFQTGFGDVVSKVVEFVSGSLISLKGTFQVVGTTIAATMAAIATGSLQPLKDLPGEIAKIEAQVNASRARIATAAKFPGLDDSDQSSRAAGAADRLAAATDKARISSKALAAILSDPKADAFAKAMESLQKAVAGADAELLALTSQSKELVPLQKALAEMQASDLWKKASQDFRDQFEALTKVGIATQQATRDFKALGEAAAEYASTRAKEHDDYLKQQSQVIAQTTDLVRGYEEANNTLEAEISVIGESDLAHQHLAATLQFEAERRKIVAARTIDNADAMDAELAKLEEQFRRRHELIDVAFSKDQMVQASGALSDVLYGFFQNGLGYAKNFWASFKDMAFRALAEIAAKQIIVSITGAVGLGGAGLASASGGGIGGSLLSGLGSLFGGETGIGGALSNISTIIPTFSTLLGSGSSLFSAATTAFAGMGSSFAALAGPIGLAAIGIPALIGLFKKGPANRSATFGSGDLGSDPSRDLAFSGSSAFGAFGVTSDKHLNEKDVGATQAFGALISGITSLDNTIAKMVGGDLTKQIADALSAHSITVGLGKEKTDVGASGGPLEILKDRYVTVLGAIDARLGTLVQGFEGTGDELAQFVVGLLALRQQLGATFDALDADQIAALGDAFGGLDKLAGSLSFLNANFTSEADNAVKAQQQLIDSFSQLGLAVPATHEAFLDLLSTFPLTTEAGRDLYASVMGLSGAFVAVNGTATQAMESLRASIAGLEDARAAYLGTPSKGPQSALNSLVSEFAGSRDWAQQIVDVSGVGGLVNVLSQIVQSDFANYSQRDQKLITDILNAGAAARPQQQAGGTISASDAYAAVFGSSTGGTSSVAAADTSQEQVAKLLQMFANLAGQSTGDFGEKLALQIRLVTGAISDAGRFSQTAALLRKTNAEFAASLALFNDLSARYGDSIAEQLVKLTESYNAQASDLKGNAVALDVLHQVFEEQWAAIVNGTATGVDGTMDQLRRLQQGILDYVDSLKIGADSPLTASQKLDLARTQYESDLIKAGAGDQEALGEITRSADAYIKLARDFYASSQSYADVFNTVTGQLTALGTAGGTMTSTDLQAASTFVATTQATTTGIPLPTPPVPGTDAAVATAKDVRDMASVIVEAIYEAAMLAAKSSADDAGKVSESVDRSKAALVEAISVGLK